MRKNNILVLGDSLTFAIITIIGFATHGEADISYLPRIGATFFPVLIGWFLLAPWLGLFDEQIISNPKNLWRVAFAVIFTAPFAAVLRSALLNNAALPIFVLILGGSNALGMLIWRWIYFLLVSRSYIRT